MIRKIIQIDENRCNGCGLCVNACHESALAIVNGKARLMRDDYCDGMGDCLPNCPMGAISFTEREAAEYDREAVEANMRRKADAAKGCPGSRMRDLTAHTSDSQFAPAAQPAQLRNWPVQIKLAPLKAPYFAGTDLLIAADCTAFAYAGMHADFMRGKVTLIGCPKLDDIDYSEKLTAIIRNNNIQSVTVVRMEVPCCGGLVMAVQRALQNTGKDLPCQIVTISIDGTILE